jgi:hypothetical protein
MNDLTSKVYQIFNNGIKSAKSDANHVLYGLSSDNLLTKIFCSNKLCFDNLKKLSSKFNKLFSNFASNSNKKVIEVFLMEENFYPYIELLFNHSGWSISSNVREFNKAVSSTSYAKCTPDDKFYIIKCYDYFYYLYNKETNQCLITIKNEKRALSMVNILLLVPYLAYGDLYAIHGGIVGNGRNNILITSFSLSGKTTFSLLFLEHNWRIITEETTYITKLGELLDYPIRNYFNIRIGTYLEFKNLFIKRGIINKEFLSMSKRNKKDLFDLGKTRQISIDFDILCKNKSKLNKKQITHVLDVCLRKGIKGMIIKKIKLTEIINKFLEISKAPTTMLFRNLMNINNIEIRKARKNLEKILQNVQCYSVISDLNYRKNFNYLLNKIGIK